MGYDERLSTKAGRRRRIRKLVHRLEQEARAAGR